jgi:hypothetical protein
VKQFLLIKNMLLLLQWPPLPHQGGEVVVQDYPVVEGPLPAAGDICVVCLADEGESSTSFIHVCMNTNLARWPIVGPQNSNLAPEWYQATSKICGPESGHVAR